MTRQMYAVFTGTKWGRYSRKVDALISAQNASTGLNSVATVRAMTKDSESWDAPTFQTCSDVIAVFVNGRKLNN